MSFWSAGLGPVPPRTGFGAAISRSRPFIQLLSRLAGEDGLDVFLCCVRKGAVSSRTGFRAVANRAATCCGVWDRTGSLTSLRSKPVDELTPLASSWSWSLLCTLSVLGVAANLPILSLTEPISGGLESVSEGTEASELYRRLLSGKTAVPMFRVRVFTSCAVLAGEVLNAEVAP